MMLPNNEKTQNWNSSEDEENEVENGPKKLNTSNGGTKYADLESSGVFVAGYTGPIHKWEHPGYQFLNESAQGMCFEYSFINLTEKKERYIFVLESYILNLLKPFAKLSFH